MPSLGYTTTSTSASTAGQSQTSAPMTPRAMAPSRRAVTRGLVWSAPAVAIAATAPAYASSTLPACTGVDGHTGIFVRLDFENLTEDERWRDGSVAYLRVRVGRRANDGVDVPDQPGMGFWAARTGLTLTMTQTEFHLSLPLRVEEWATVPSGWAISGTAQRVTMVPAVINSPIALGTTTTTHEGEGVVVEASDHFVARLDPTQFANGDLVKQVSHTFTTDFRFAWNVTGTDCSLSTNSFVWNAPIVVNAS